MCRKKETPESKAARNRVKYQQMTREFNYRSEGVKFFNREADFKRKTQFIASIGESRQQSDIRQRVMDKRAVGLKSKEKLAQKYATTRFVNEGGSSTKAGRNIYQQIQMQRAAIDRGIQVAAGRGEAIQQEQQRRIRQSMLSKEYAAKGVLPQFGPPLIMPPKIKEGGNPLMGVLSLGLGIATAGKSKIFGI